MALLYRAIWNDDTEDLNSFALKLFDNWVREKHPGDWEIVSDGSVYVDAEKLHDVTAKVGQDENGIIQRLVLHENRQGERWTTTLTSLVDAEGQGSLWVDLERVTEDPYARVSVMSPNLVAMLVDEGTNPRRGRLGLTTSPQAIRPTGVQELVSLLTDPERDLPVVVFTKPNEMDGADWVKMVERTSTRLAATAVVRMLPPDAIDPFVALVGRELAVWGGALRVYLPGFSIDNPRPWRHRYFLTSQIGLHWNRPSELIGAHLSKFLAAQRAPENYDRVRLLLRGVKDTLDLDDIDAWLNEKDEEIDRLELENERLRRERDDAISDYLSAEHDRAAIQANFVLQRKAEDGHVELEDYPVAADRCSEVVEYVRRWLKRVILPEAAAIDLHDLDAAVESSAWASTAWSGFQALDAYASDAGSFRGGFWQWCLHSGNPLVWPATPKKLAMSESESVITNERMREQRRFSVPASVDESGFIVMEAHLKVAEGGGDLAPRIYFYDDTAGNTGKIHVGYFGPHRHLSNTRT